MPSSRDGAYGIDYTLDCISVVHVCLTNRTTNASATVSDCSVTFSVCSGSRFRLLSSFFRLLSAIFRLLWQSFPIAQHLFPFAQCHFPIALVVISDCSAAFSDCSVLFSDCSGGRFRLLSSVIRLLRQSFPIAEQIILYANTSKSNYTVASQVNNF